MRRKIISRIIDAYERSLFWQSFIGVLAVGPPALLAVGAYHPSLKTFLESYPIWVFVCGGWVVLPAIGVAVRLATKRERYPLSQEHLMMLFDCVERIVGHKFERFAKKFRALKGEGPKFDGSAVFDNITQPEEQMERIIEQAWIYFYTTREDPDVEIKVALASMGPKHISEFVAFQPKDKGPRTEPQDLQTPFSGFSQAKRTKNIVIIEDLDRESRKAGNRQFVVKDDRFEEGSIICYPVESRHHGIPYIISVRASKKGHFRKRRRKQYEFILSCFANRIVLEHSLKVMKQRTVG